MEKIRIVIKAGKRRNPVAKHVRRCKGGPHRHRRKDAIAREKWLSDMDDYYRPSRVTEEP